jgi:hypothetical protein
VDAGARRRDRDADRSREESESTAHRTENAVARRYKVAWSDQETGAPARWSLIEVALKVADRRKGRARGIENATTAVDRADDRIVRLICEPVEKDRDVMGPH